MIILLLCTQRLNICVLSIWIFLCDCSVKMMKGPAPHSQLDADLAGGMGMPDNGPKLMSA